MTKCCDDAPKTVDNQSYKRYIRPFQYQFGSNSASLKKSSDTPLPILYTIYVKFF